MRLQGKNVFVTGGSRGIGKAICLALAAEGANIVFSYCHNAQLSENVVSEIQRMGVKASAVCMEVRDREQVRFAIAHAERELGNIDAWVNNAGINKPTDFDQITDADWDDIIDVNLKGPFICSQEVMEVFKRQQYGNIINIGSVSGQYGGPRTAHYAASKAGLISLSQVIARFGAQYNVRCNVIAAGLIASEMAGEGLKAASVSKAAENILLKRFGSTQEVGKVVAFLISEESSYITAQTINVNGGLYF